MRAADGRKVPAVYGAVLKANEKGEYKVFEYGNFPLLFIDGQLRPRNYQFRLKLPPDYDWTGREDKSIETMQEQHGKSKKDR